MNDTFQEIQHQQIGARSPVQPCPCPNTWNVSQIISRACCTIYYKYRENLAPASRKAATGHLYPLFKPWKGFLLHTNWKQRCCIADGFPAQHPARSQPCRSKAGKPCSGFCFWSTNEIWAFTTLLCFLVLFALFTVSTLVLDFYSSTVNLKYTLQVLEIHRIQHIHLLKDLLKTGDSGCETWWSTTTFKTIRIKKKHFI